MTHKTTRIYFVVALLLCCDWAYGQSNYASQANNVEYQGEGLPEEATLDGKVSILMISGYFKVNDNRA
jgi:hypothetical protein